jgi:BASS family bile acid:Na+ symporter
MSTQQLILSLVLATMVFAVALEVKGDDFRRVAQTPKAVICGLIPQFILLPVGTWLATLMLDLPPNVEVAMILVASCPGGSLSNVVTHYGRGNTALSVSVSAVASVIALFATPFNFSWMVASNPNTAQWLKVLAIDPSDIWLSLVLLLALPMSLGLVVASRLPALTARIRKPLSNFALFMLLAFIVAGLFKERQLLNMALLPLLLIVVLHNACGLFFGWITSVAMGVSVRDRRAVMIEGGMQNAGLALGIIAVQFNSDLGMVTIASLWGIWHIVSGMTLATIWRRHDAKHG